MLESMGFAPALISTSSSAEEPDEILGFLTRRYHGAIARAGLPKTYGPCGVNDSGPSGSILA